MARQLIAEKRKHRDYEVLIEDQRIVFKNGMALVYGTIISEDRTLKGKIVWGLIDEGYKEVLYKSHCYQNIPLDKLSRDGYDIGFNCEFTNFIRIGANDFIGKKCSSDQRLNGIYYHIRIEGSLTYSSFLGHVFKTTPNPNMFIANPATDFQFYYFDKMIFSKPVFEKIGDFIDYCPEGETTTKKVSFVRIIHGREYIYNPNYPAVLECYVDTEGHCVSPLYSIFSNQCYTIKPDWSDYDEVMEQVLKANEEIRNEREKSADNLKEKIYLPEE